MAKSTLPGKICSHVACSLRDERLKQNVSLNVLAARAGLSRQMVSYVEQELRKPTLDTLLRICEALEIRVEDLIAKARKAAAKAPKK
jgi:transcriptional regulator with XRE-family HTH domain